MADRVIIFGSRAYKHRSLVVLRVAKLPAGTTVVVGGAFGPDKIAESTAQGAGLPTEVHRAVWYPDGGKLDRGAGHKRNERMGALGASLAIGFWDGQSKGTAGMVGVCKRHGIPLELWDAEGTLTTAEDATLRLWRDRH